MFWFLWLRKQSGNIDDVVDEILDYQVDGIILASVAVSSKPSQSM